MNKFQEIIESYPNFMNNDLPHEVDCVLEDGDDIKNPFTRVLPKIFSIENVNHARKRDGCYYRVKYRFNDGTDLPTGPGLKPLVDLLKKYWPWNTLIVDEEIHLPKCILITYAVYCKCSHLDFDVPVQTADVWAIQETFKKFLI